MHTSAIFRLRAFLSSCFSWDKAFARRVVAITLPIVLQNLIASSLQIVDGLMVSGLGDVSYAAVVQTNRYTFLFQLFCFGVASGGAIFMSQFWGAGDIRRIRQSMGVSLLWTGAVMAVFITGAGAFPDRIINVFLPQGESAAIAKVYLRWITPSYLFHGINMVYSTCLKSTEKPHLPLISGSVGLGLNTLLNYGLIYGHFGLPAMGVRGAGLATCIAAGVTLALTLLLALRKAPARGREPEGHASLGPGVSLPLRQNHDPRGVQRGPLGAGDYDVRHLLRPYGRHGGGRDGRRFQHRQPAVDIHLRYDARHGHHRGQSHRRRQAGRRLPVLQAHDRPGHDHGPRCWALPWLCIRHPMLSLFTGLSRAGYPCGGGGAADRIVHDVVSARSTRSTWWACCAPAGTRCSA